MRLPLLALLLLLPIVAVLLFVDWSFSTTKGWRLLENLGHVPLFALLTVAMFACWRFPPRGGVWRPYWLAAALAAVLALVTEVIQLGVGRDAAWIDVWRDLIGAGIGLALCAAFDRRLSWSAWRHRLVGFAAFVVLLYVLSPLVEAVRAYSHRDAIFPRLADFSNPLEKFWMTGSGAKQKLESGALRVDFVAEPWPGVSWFEPVPDWRDYRHLVVEVSNPNDLPLELTLRVHDFAHNRMFADRFNQRIALRPGERKRVAVPLEAVRAGPTGRELNLAEVSDVTLFRSGAAGPAHMIVHALRLER